MELISVIVPIYNAERFLRKNLDSIISQSYINLEIILINDGSSDASLEICERYAKRDGRIRVINKENTGVSNTRNIGIDNARGKWICFLDADDYIGTDYIKGMFDVAEETSADIVIEGYVEVCGDRQHIVQHNCSCLEIIGEEVRKLVCSILDNKSDLKNRINSQSLGLICSKLYKRNIISNIRFAENISMREDAVFNIDTILRAKKVVLTGCAMYMYMIHNESASMRFHANYSDEVLLYLKSCKKRWGDNKLPMDSYYIGVLYAYMTWLKLFVMHSASGFTYKQKIQILRDSYRNKIWKESFDGVNYSDLSKPYMALKWLYGREWSSGIYLLYVVSRILRRK